MILRQLRQDANHGDGSGCAGGAGYSERCAFDATGRYRDCAAADASIRNGERQDDVKRCAGRSHGLELTVRNLL